MSTKSFPLPQPVGAIETVCSLQALSKMNKYDWDRFRAFVITLAAKHLDTYERFEMQDPERVRLFYTTFHSEWPEIRKKYQNSWVLVRYIKMYLAHKKWTRKARDCRTKQERRARTLSPAKTSASSYVSNPGASAEHRSGMLMSSSTRPHPAVVVLQNGRKPSLPDQVSPTVFQFLQSVKPSLEKLAPDFLAAGIYDPSHLEDFVAWPGKSQSDFLLKTMGGGVNALELGALLIALENRRPGRCVR